MLKGRKEAELTNSTKMLEVQRQNLISAITQIKQKEELVRDKKIELETTKFIMQSIESKERLNIEGKNQQEREALLMEKLSSNPDYSLHKGVIANLSKELETKKIEINYLINLFSVEKMMSRYMLVESLRTRGI